MATESAFKIGAKNVLAWLTLAGMAFLVLYGLWDNATRAFLGWLGVIEYKTKTEVRYERFLERAKDCQIEKSVFSEKSSKYPVFVVANCGERGELIWSYEVEVIKKAPDGRWILEK